jgi:TRAP-type transport system periplasmic protein
VTRLGSAALLTATLASFTAATLAPFAAGASPTVLRLATAAPDGSAWAREFKAYSRDVEAHTNGDVTIKWYFGAIAGDELEVQKRIARGQVDGIASGGGLCTELSATQRAMRVQDLLQSHGEGTWLMGRMNEQISQEFLAHQLVFLGGPVIGGEVVFSRDQIRTFDELKTHRLWRWDVDRAGIALSRAAGLNIVPEPLTEILHAYENHQLDAFLSIPSTMLAFQLLPKVKHVQDWPHSYLIGCLLIAQRAFDPLTVQEQQTLRADGLKAILRVDEVARETDEKLLGGLLQKQGISVEHAPPALQDQLLSAMHDAHKKFSDPPISDEIVKKVRQLLEEHRAKK